MIVLMATGNTPILDGARSTASAHCLRTSRSKPEAPMGGRLSHALPRRARVRVDVSRQHRGRDRSAACVGASRGCRSTCADWNTDRRIGSEKHSRGFAGRARTESDPHRRPVVAADGAGLRYFWQRPLEELVLADGSRVLGELVERERIPDAAAAPDGTPAMRWRVKTANRDITVRLSLDRRKRDGHAQPYKRRNRGRATRVG